jgi:hypothetical protein
MSVRRRCAEDLLNYCNPFAANLSPPPPSQDDALPAVKRPRLEASTSVSTAEDAADADTFFDADKHILCKHDRYSDNLAVAPTYTITVSASLQSAGAARAPYQHWTSEQDAKLIDAVKEHGKKWVAVAAMLPGRTNIQCRCSRWADTVKEHGKKWVTVAALVPGRIENQCRHRWVDTLDPSINSGKWTLEEDAKLTDAVKEHGKKWDAVAVMVPGRTNVWCRARWAESLDPDLRTGKWTGEEDAKLTGAVQGCCNRFFSEPIPGGTDISRGRPVYMPTVSLAGLMLVHTPNRTSKLILFFAVQEHGKKWAAVAVLVPGRTPKQCFARWAESLDPDIT